MSPSTHRPTIVDHFQASTREILEILDRLVRLDTPTGNAAAIGRFVGEYRRLLEETGMGCEEIDGPGGPLLHAFRDPEAGREPPIVLVGHSDTVWPTGEAERRPPRLEGNRFFGPGAFDMKCGLAVVVAALRWLRETGWRLRRPLSVFVSPDEEVGSVTAHAHAERLIPPEATALVLEPPLPDGSLKAWRKGVGMYRLEVRGREAHAGNEPELGVNAIVELSRKVLEVSGWTDSGRGILVNVGSCEGGVATNVVPGFAAAGIDTRFDRTEDGEEVDRRLRSLGVDDPRASIALTGGIIFPPLAPDARSQKLVETAIAIAADLGLRISAGRSGGGSDGSFLASRGVAVLDGLGVDGGGAHAVEEHVLVDRIPVRAALLARLILELDGRSG